jgi:hypothetical protein
MYINKSVEKHTQGKLNQVVDGNSSTMTPPRYQEFVPETLAIIKLIAQTFCAN